MGQEEAWHPISNGLKHRHHEVSTGNAQTCLHGLLFIVYYAMDKFFAFIVA
jgi:hypothetical protein